MPSPLHQPILRWYADHQRDLPWRRPEASAWSVLVSELMLQQTPVARVLPMHEEWLERWPTPAGLAAEPAGEAVRAWGRLGYPRRALRLHAAAVAIVERHGGEVPDAYGDLIALPGVGDYTAAAVASFAFRQRHVVLDTNVRRVLARALSSVEFPGASVTRAERELAASVLPASDETAATWRWRSWSWAPWCAPPAARAAGTARSPTGAPGWGPARRRTTGRPVADRPGPGPTASAEAG